MTLQWHQYLFTGIDDLLILRPGLHPVGVGPVATPFLHDALRRPFRRKRRPQRRRFHGAQRDAASAQPDVAEGVVAAAVAVGCVATPRLPLQNPVPAPPVQRVWHRSCQRLSQILKNPRKSWRILSIPQESFQWSCRNLMKILKNPEKSKRIPENSEGSLKDSFGSSKILQKLQESLKILKDRLEISKDSEKILRKQKENG